MAVLCIWLGAEAWVALMLAAVLGLGFEWTGLCGCPGTRLPGAAVLAAILAGVGTALLNQHGWALGVLVAGGLAVSLASPRRGLGAGVLYIGVPLVALAWLRAGEAGRADVLFVVLVVWASDIGAYGVGRALGGPKLAPAISPGKTWSGAVGGVVIAMLVGEAAAQLLAPGSVGRAALVAGLVAVASVGGDLLESWIKRRFGVKDSGHLIPGHGGMMDRLDGLLGAAPAAALVAFVLGRGDVLWR